MFGIATTAERLLTGLTLSSPPAYMAIAHYATPASKFLIVLPSSDRAEVWLLASKLRGVGIDAEIRLSELPTWEERWVWTLEQLSSMAIADHSRPWYGLVDDDTFFPSISDIWLMLQRYQEPTRTSWYIGAECEEDWIQDQFPSRATGGGGLFLSSALLRDISVVFTGEICPKLRVEADPIQPADEWLGVCLREALGVKVSYEKAMHQVHGPKTVDGVYESPGELSTNASLPREQRPRLLSVHHWRLQGQERDLPSMATVTRKSGVRTLMHRYLIWDSDLEPHVVPHRTTAIPSPRGFWVMSNGYSLVHYNLAQPAARADNARAYKCSEQCWDPAGGDDWGSGRDTAEKILGFTEIEEPSMYDRVWEPVRPRDGDWSKRYSFRAALPLDGKLAWTGYFVHETDTMVDIVQVIWV